MAELSIWYHVAAVVGLGALCAGWVVVQRAIARVDPETGRRVEQRRGCGGCGGGSGDRPDDRCEGRCERRQRAAGGERAGPTGAAAGPQGPTGATAGARGRLRKTRHRRYLASIVLVGLLLGVGLGRRLLGHDVAARGGDGAAPDRTAATAGSGGGEGAPRLVRRASRSMATIIEVLLPERDADAAEIVFSTFREVDARMSEWKPSSPLSAVNRAAGVRPVAVDRDLLDLVERALAISRETGGAFDVSWAALWGLWSFTADHPRVPPAAQIERRLRLVDYRRVEIDRRASTIALARRGMKIGLGAIAKGYALDLAVKRLVARGVEHFMISAGGQVYASGSRGGRPWRVGIRDPRGGRGDHFAVLEVTDTSVSTSGDYERYFIQDGVRYHHILDPRTGRPARGLRSATVICTDATLGDGLSTALMVLGPERGLALAERLAGVEAVLVDARGRVRMTSGAKHLVRRLR